MDAISDGRHVLIGAIIEHIELAGTHSGDAIMVIPPQTLPVSVTSRIEYYTRIIANSLKIKGPFNIQFLVKDGVVYIIELNLRASRSMPYTSKSTGIPLLWIAGKVMLGRTLPDLRLLKRPKMLHVSVKAPTFSFMRLKGADPILGVEMTSTGEVACMDYDFASALIKALIASNVKVPEQHKPVLITVRKEDYDKAIEIAKNLSSAGYPIYATKGTAEALRKSLLDEVKVFKKIHEVSDDGENIIESLSKHEIGMVINTPHVLNRNSIDDNYKIRRTAVEFFIPVITRIETAEALADALIKMGGELMIRPRPLDEYLVGSRFLRYI